MTGKHISIYKWHPCTAAVKLIRLIYKELTMTRSEVKFINEITQLHESFIY